jgi:hypothetical protein
VPVATFSIPYALAVSSKLSKFEKSNVVSPVFGSINLKFVL